MPAAKFYAIGDINQWFRLRIQEEIQANNLEGSILDTGENRLVVIVEGSIAHIKSLYNGLNESKPQGIVLTSLVFGDFKEKISISKANLSRELLDVLKEIEKSLRRINQKLDVLSAKISSEVKSERADIDSKTLPSDDTNPFDAFFNSEL